MRMRREERREGMDEEGWVVECIIVLMGFFFGGKALVLEFDEVLMTEGFVRGVVIGLVVVLKLEKVHVLFERFFAKILEGLIV